MAEMSELNTWHIFIGGVNGSQECLEITFLDYKWRLINSKEFSVGSSPGDVAL